MKMPRLLLMTALVCASFSAHAFQLGQLKTESRLGQPLSAHISIYGMDAAEAESVSLELKPEIMARRDSPERAVVAGMSARLVQDSTGRSVVALSSGSAVTEPFVRFRLRVISIRGTSVRHYTLVPNPIVTLRPESDREQASRSTTATPDAAALGSVYGPVRSGQSLWRILRELNLTSSNTDTLIADIVKLNPHAFHNSDPSRLKVGVTLSMPTPPTTTHANTSGAESAPAPGPEVEITATPPSVSNYAANEQAQVESIRKDIQTSTAATVLPSTSAVSSQTDEGASDSLNRFKDTEIEKRLAEVERKFKAIKARYAAQQALKSDANAAEQSGAGVAVDTVAAPLAKRASSKKASTPAAAAATLSERVVDEPAPGTSLSTRILAGFAAVLGLMAFSIACVSLYRRYRVFKISGDEAAQDEQRLAEIARKSEKRLQLEDEVRRRLSEKRAPTPERAVAEPETGNNDQIAAIEEIENRIAHGQYAEAEKMLNQVIAKTPNNFRAKLRLAEIFYLNERTDEFVDMASELSAKHRDDIGDEGWQRIMRMGKVAAPERPPFSGPVAVEQQS